MSFNRSQFEDLIRETLDEHGLGGDRAVALLLGTAAVESAFGTYLKQVRGPALGIMQMEPLTFDWLQQKYQDVVDLPMWPPERMMWDLKLAILMARLRYLVDPEPLPAATDKWTLGAYWVRVYNTSAGAGTVRKFVEAWDKYVT